MTGLALFPPTSLEFDSGVLSLLSFMIAATVPLQIYRADTLPFSHPSWLVVFATVVHQRLAVPIAAH